MQNYFISIKSIGCFSQSCLMIQPPRLKRPSKSFKHSPCPFPASDDAMTFSKQINQQKKHTVMQNHKTKVTSDVPPLAAHPFLRLRCTALRMWANQRMIFNCLKASKAMKTVATRVQTPSASHWWQYHRHYVIPHAYCPNPWTPGFICLCLQVSSLHTHTFKFDGRCATWQNEYPNIQWNEMKWNEKMMKWKDDESFWKYQYNLTNDWSPDLHVGDKRPACRSNSLRMPSIKWPATAASDASGPALWSLPLSLSLIFIFSWSLGNAQYHQLNELNVFAGGWFCREPERCELFLTLHRCPIPRSYELKWSLTLENSRRKSLSISMGCCLRALETQNRDGVSTDMDDACWGKP